MESINRKEKKTQQPHERTTIGTFFDAEFLTSKRARRWYPYFAFLFLLAVISIKNEKSIQEKENTVNKLEIEYQRAVSKLEKSIQFIPYHYQQYIMNTMKQKGFVLDADKRFIIKANEKEDN